jgi:class 3 adenylate cyclase/tetratricopeptide (TPR) repeat protein
MLFCDVVGSTKMAEQLDPEEWAEIMNEAFDYLIAPVYRYEGTIARLQGDGLLAFFGAPVAHEDDPVRAVLAGLDMLSDLDPFRAEIQEDYGLDFNVRVGINTGPVVVGDIGADQALEYTAMGDAINLAARMETTASPGTVQIAHNTYRLVAPLFEVEALGTIEVKGKEESVPAYRVIGRKDRPGRLRGIEGLDAPLVGRKGEFTKLTTALDALRGGRGQIVFLVGEAGLGKSRLLSEMAEYWRQIPDNERYWTSAQGIPYETGRPYSLFYQRIRNNLGIEDNDSPDDVRRKIERALRAFPPAQKSAIAQAVETLMAVEGRAEGPRLEAEALKRQLFDLTSQVWRNEGLVSPSVAVFDDLHWSDPASAELIIHLLELVEEVPVMILCAMRPYHDSPGWQVKEAAAEQFPEHYSEVILAPLADDDSDELVNHLLLIADLSEDLRQLILQKSEGNPFFVEEVVRTLIDMGAIVKEEGGQRWRAARPIEGLTIPDNLQSMLTSRIDRLDQETKQTLQMASVIGRNFYQRVLAYIADRIQKLDDELEALQRAQLILQAARQPEIAYMFRHELTRDATYHTLLRRQRRKYHRRVGEAMEALFPERLNEEAHRLAYHFGQAGDKARALKYHEIAGDQAARLYANKEAADHYAEAIDLAKDSGDGQLLLRLYSTREKALTFDGRFDEAMTSSQELEALAQKMNAPGLALEAIAARGTLLAMPSVIFDAERAQALLEQALVMAEDLGHTTAEAKIQWSLMMANNNLGGTPEKSLAYGQRSLAIAREHNLDEQLAYTLHDMTRPLAMLGQFGKALEYSEEAGRLFREQNNMPMVVDNMATASSGYFLMGELDLALERAQEALVLAREIGSLWGESYAQMRMGFALVELGYVGQAFKAWEAAGGVAQEASFIGLTFYVPALVGIHVLSMGACDRGQQIVLQLAEESRRNKKSEGARNMVRTDATDGIMGRVESLFHLCRRDVGAARAALPPQMPATGSNLLDAATYGGLSAADGRVLLAAKEFDSAKSLARSTREVLEQISIKVPLPELRQIEARALLAMGQREEGLALLRQAADEARAMNARRQLWPILGLLARLAQEDGAEEEAAELRHETASIIALIADDVDDELRQSFLALPEVREVGTAAQTGDQR